MLGRFLDLVERSVVVQGVVTTLLVVTACVLWLRGMPVPVALQHLTWAVVGFWMGSKVQVAALGAHRARREKTPGSGYGIHDYRQGPGSIG